MHEWALAESVASSVAGFSRKKKLSRVSEIEVGLGEMQDIDRETFRFAFSELVKKQPLLKNSRLRMREEKTRLRCLSCGNEWTFSFRKKLSHDQRESIHFVPEISQAYIKCPKCGSRDFEITAGRGIRIKSVKGE
jgi:hydrogenase nickel incorporation protein HypA/HybF